MVFTGFFLMYIAHNITYKVYTRLAQLGIFVAIALLIITLVAGAEINSAGRWLVIPIINQKFQTSDFAKIALILFVARQLTIHKNHIDNFKQGVIPVIIPIAIVCALILPENFSTSALLFLICMIMMFIGRVKVKHLALIVGIAAVGFFMLVLIAKIYPDVLPRMETWSNRIFNYASEEPKEQWQINNAQQAIYNGGLFGLGPGNGQLKHILPQAYADFVFASFIEEFGIIGGIFLLLLYLILLFRIIRIATNSEKTFNSFVVIGLGLNLVFMALINMAVCTKLVPVTGQNMPLISMGGTSTWFTFISLGIIQSIAKAAESNELKNKPALKKQQTTDAVSAKGGDHALA
jgi:cell division protein FtsW